MIRAFVAAILPYNIKEEIHNKLLKTDKEFPPSLNGNFIRWVTKENFHITLKFFKEIDELNLNKVNEFLINYLKNQNKLNVELKGFSSFKINGEDKILWAEISSNDFLSNLYKNLNEFSSTLGFKKEKNYFVPHVTVARLKGNENKSKINFLISEVYDNLHFQIENISILKSKLTTNGAVYKTLYNFSLN